MDYCIHDFTITTTSMTSQSHTELMHIRAMARLVAIKSPLRYKYWTSLSLPRLLVILVFRIFLSAKVKNMLSVTL